MALKNFITETANRSAFLKDIEKALEEVAKKHGLKMRRGNARYTEARIKFSGVEFTCATVETQSGETMQGDARVFSSTSWRYGVPAATYGKLFKFQGQAWRVSGCTSRKCKYPILATNTLTGEVRRYTSHTVLSNLV